MPPTREECGQRRGPPPACLPGCGRLPRPGPGWPVRPPLRAGVRQGGVPAAAGLQERPEAHQLARLADGHDGTQTAGPAEQRDELPLFERAFGDLHLVVTTRGSRAPGSGCRTGPTRNTGSGRTTVRRHVRPRTLRAAATPASAATCQCSIRISSSPPSWRHFQRAMSPAETMPSAAKSRSSHTTPFSTSARSRRATRSTARRRCRPRRRRRQRLAFGEFDHEPAPAPAPTSTRAGPPCGCAATATPVRSSTPLAPCNDPQCAPSIGPRTLRSGMSSASSTVTRAPSPTQVEATSAPMNPAPMMTTRRRVHRRHGRPQGDGVVEGPQGEEAVALAQVLGAGEPAGRWHPS